MNFEQNIIYVIQITNMVATLNLEIWPTILRWWKFVLIEIMQNDRPLVYIIISLQSALVSPVMQKHLKKHRHHNFLLL
jgi:hypothetical protein